ncbi:MAG: hypothetical protein JXQ29_03090 [Planctomycetes bacterium]|nr:hypothetical protein [Planctomycetota bacterium]
MRSPSFCGFVVLLAGAAAAQTTMYTSANRPYQSTVWLQSMVRSRAGHLFVVYTDPFRPPQNDIAVGRSTDGGRTWNMQWQTGFAALAATDLGNNSPAVAIDDQDNLHLVWCHVGVDDNSWSNHYLRWDASRQAWGPEVALNSPARRQRYNGIAVDSRNQVWILTNTGFWLGFLQRSNVPYAADHVFNNFSPPLATSLNFEHMHMIVDALDRLHIGFYNFGASWSNYHLWIDPGASSPAWSAMATFGTPNSGADFYTALAADLAGNVYCVYGVETPGVSSGPDPYWELRKWDGITTAWSSPIAVGKTTRTNLSQGGKDNDCAFLAAACDETTGELYFTYRDLDTGTFRLLRWRDGNPAPTPYATLMTTGSKPANTLNYFMHPQIRGTLFPYFNRASVELHISYEVGDETASTPNYTLFLDRFPVGSLKSLAAPRLGTAFPLDISALADAGKSYVLGLSMTGIQPGIALQNRFLPLVPDSLFFVTVQNLVPSLFRGFQGVLDGSGMARASLVIPNAPALVNLALHAAFVTWTGTAGLSTISNPLTFTIAP